MSETSSTQVSSQSAASFVADVKKHNAKLKADFELHVGMIMYDGVARSKATFMAWSEGPDGLKRRLQRREPELPLISNEVSPLKGK